MKYRITAISYVLLISFISISAQPPAPVKLPSQLATAKTIFIGFGGAPIGIDSDRQIPVTRLVITGIQQGLSTSGRYTQVDKPSDAELSLRLSVEPGYGIRLAIFDTKTGALLWTIDEGIEGGARKETIIKNINTACTKVVSDLEALASEATVSTPSTAPIKQPISDEGKK